jgi:hypothetical protein
MQDSIMIAEVGDIENVSGRERDDIFCRLISPVDHGGIG